MKHLFALFVVSFGVSSGQDYDYRSIETNQDSLILHESEYQSLAEVDYFLAFSAEQGSDQVVVNEEYYGDTAVDNEEYRDLLADAILKTNLGDVDTLDEIFAQAPESDEQLYQAVETSDDNDMPNDVDNNASNEYHDMINNLMAEGNDDYEDILETLIGEGGKDYPHLADDTGAEVSKEENSAEMDDLLKQPIEQEDYEIIQERIDDENDFAHFLSQGEIQDDIVIASETEDIQKDDTEVLDELEALLNNAKPSDDLDLLLGDAESILKDVDSLLGCEEGSTNCHQQVITAVVKKKDSLTVEFPPEYVAGVPEENAEDFVYFKDIGSGIKVMQVTLTLVIFTGSVVLIVGGILATLHIWYNVRSQPPSNTQDFKTVKLAGIVKSYGKLPVDIRTMKNPNFVYEELYEKV